MFKIVCMNEIQFFNTIEQLTMRGLGFVAHYETLTIEPSGAF